MLEQSFKWQHWNDVEKRQQPTSWLAMIVEDAQMRILWSLVDMCIPIFVPWHKVSSRICYFIFYSNGVASSVRWVSGYCWQKDVQNVDAILKIVLWRCSLQSYNILFTRDIDPFCGM